MSAWSELSRNEIAPERVVALADEFGRLVGPEAVALPVFAEATVTLQSLARELAGAGRRVLNVVSSRYGHGFEAWLRGYGGVCESVEAPAGRALSPAALDEALSHHPEFDTVFLAHGEAITGVLHPLPELVAVAHRHGALIAVDAVATVGAVAIPAEADAVVLGPQKALGGPSGLSAAVISPTGWPLLAPGPDPVPSALSLRWLRDEWLRRGRAETPGIPPVLDVLAVEDAFLELEREGLCARLERHRTASRAVRAGLRAGGVQPRVPAAEANPLATAVDLSAGLDAAAVSAAARQAGGRWLADVDGAVGPAVRSTHFAAGATPAGTTQVLVALAAGLAAAGGAFDLGAALDAAAAAWGRAAATAA
jgi:aspartate aminotransferase-like enzyme